jgi:hypothetical protein
VLLRQVSFPVLRFFSVTTTPPMRLIHMSAYMRILPRLKIGGNIPSLPHMPSWRGAKLGLGKRDHLIINVYCMVFVAVFQMSFQFYFLFFFRLFRKIEKSDSTSSCLFVRPSFRMEQFGSHWKDFNEIWYLSFFFKCVQKIQVSLKSDKNNGYFNGDFSHL